jgi:outer membrane protein OmpA-like peptidoglycan-associated protein
MMSPGNSRDWSGLLYLPGEELVHSTIDGDDADWSDSLSYVPPDSLVRSVLDASVRDRPAFVLPPRLLPANAPFGAPNRLRRTAALLAGLGLSPFSLAAAAALHVVLLFAVGPWIVTQAGAAHSIGRPPTPPPPPIVVTRLVYVLPATRAAPPIKPAPKRAARAMIRPPTENTSSGAQTVFPSPADSGRAVTSETRQGSSPEREAVNALSQELFFARDGFDLETPDMPKLDLIVRVLTRWPGLRVRVLGAAPRRREPGPLPGMAEAEAVKRALVQAGIDGGRIEVGQIPEAERLCPEREPACAAARRRVRTMVASPP